VSIQDQGGFGFLGLHGATSARVSLNRSIPWQISLGSGASRSRLQLAGLHLTSLEVSGGAEQVEVTLPRPTGTVPVRISGGASAVSLHRPSGAAISVDMSGGASSLTVDGQHHSIVGGGVSWRSSDFDSASDRYQLEISGGASNVTVDQRG